MCLFALGVGLWLDYTMVSIAGPASTIDQITQAVIAVDLEEQTQTIVQEYFNMMMIVDFSKTEKDFLVAANELENIGESIGVIIKAQREDIFDMMHRI